MSNELLHILRLYESGECPPDLSDAQRKELGELRVIKDRLDRRVRPNVPEDAVQAVLRMAAGEIDGPAFRPDRRPVRYKRRHVWMAAGSSLALAALAGSLLLLPPSESPIAAPQDTAVISESPFEPSDMTAMGAVPALDAPASGPEPASRLVSRSGERSALSAAPLTATDRQNDAAAGVQLASAVDDQAVAGLSWDDQHDVQRLHMMIELLQERGDDFEWDEPAVPLELLGQQETAGGRALRQVSHPLPRR